MLREDANYYYWEKGERYKLGKHYFTREFDCQCVVPSCYTQKIAKSLIEALNKVSEEYGMSILITSGYRCQHHQDELRQGGAETALGVSRHTDPADAADIRPIILSGMHDLLTVVKKHFTGIGASSRFIHCDLRPKAANWSYTN